jgi:hypothetical protein
MAVPSISLRAAIAIPLACTLAACASADYHYSQLSGRRYHLTPIDTYSVSIVRIDGKDNTFRPALVDPGLREITVQGPPGGIHGVGVERSIALQVAPCTRYYLVAVKTNQLASDFSIRVDHEEPVAGCSPPQAS